MTDAALLEGFSKAATASIADALDKIVGRRCYMDHQIKPRINEARICGPAVTVLEMPTNEFLPPQLAYRAFESYTGSDQFTFVANDGQVDSNVATVSITVTTAPVSLDEAPEPVILDPRLFLPAINLDR